MPTFFPYWYAISCTSGSEFTRMETLNEKEQTVNEKNIKSAVNEAFLHLSAIYVKTERTYCFTTVCNKTRCLLEGLLEVVFESLVLVLLGTQLHEFTCNRKAICKCILPASSSACWFSAHRVTTYLAPGPLWPEIKLLPLWCYRYEPRPLRQPRGWNLQLR